MTLSNADIQFAEIELIWSSYTAAGALSTTKRVKLINKKEFAKAALDAESKTFIVYVAELETPEMTIHPSQTVQINVGDPVQVAVLKQDETLIKILVKYSDFADVFLAEEALVLPERTELNKHVIKLKNGKQPPYG